MSLRMRCRVLAHKLSKEGSPILAKMILLLPEMYAAAIVIGVYTAISLQGKK